MLSGAAPAQNQPDATALINTSIANAEQNAKAAFAYTFRENYHFNFLHKTTLATYAHGGALLPEREPGALGTYLRRPEQLGRLLGRTCAQRKPWYAFHEKRPVSDIMQQRAGSIPLGRAGDPREMSAVVAFLASARSSFVTGTAIQVDGGSIHGLL